MTSVRAVRGATTVDADTVEQLQQRVPEMVLEALSRNGVTTDDVISIVFTATPDISSTHPATAARAGVDLSEVPMVGAQELDVPSSVQRCIRILMHIETDRARSEISHVYLHGAVALRPDLADG